MENQKHLMSNVAQKAIIFNPSDNKFLLLKGKRMDKLFIEKYGEWELAGGRVQISENIEESFIREIQEELGSIEFEIKELVDRFLIEAERGVVIFLGYLVNFLGGEIELSEEHDEFRWVTAEEMEKSDEYKPWLKSFIKKADEYIKNQENLAGWKRCQADFENYKKRQSEQQVEMIKYANQNLILDIIPVIDNFHASTDHIPEDQKENPWVTGIMYIQKQLEKVLADNGVAEIEVKVGDEFDPNLHEAIKQKTEDDDQELGNKIAKVISKGYKLNGKIIRVARVVVE